MIWLIGLSLFIFAMPFQVGATTYYSSPTGSNSNTCVQAQSSSTPKQTISGGYGCLAAGDTLILLDGTYVEGQVNMNTPGTSGSPVTIQAQNRLQAILSSTSSTTCAPNISFNASYQVIDGLRGQIDPSDPSGCTNDSANGVFVRMWGTNTPTLGGNTSTGNVGGVVRNCQVDASSHRSTGIKSNQDFSIVENCVVHSAVEAFNGNSQVVRYNYIDTGDVWGSITFVKGGARNAQFYNNQIHVSGTAWAGLWLGGNSSCCWWDAATHYECYNCTAHHNIIVVDNANTNDALDFVGCSGCTLYNNDLINGKLKMATGSQACCNPQPWPDSSVVKNNVISCLGAASTSSWGSGTNTTTDYNDFFNCTGNPSQTHAFTADPTFVNSGTGDYGLQASSTMIDAGVNVGLAYNGSAPDIGAHETIAFASCAVSAATPTVANITFNNNVQPPLLPTSSIATFTARENAVAKTVSSVARVGDNQINVTVSAAFTAATTIDFSYAVGNVTDSACIGDSTCATGNQRLNALTNQGCTNNVSGAPSYVLTQSAFVFNGLRGTEAAPVRKPYGTAGENVNIFAVPGGQVRLRLSFTCTTADCPAFGFYPYYSRNGGAYAVVPAAFDANNITYCGTANDPDIPTSGTATTNQLTTSGTFVSGALLRTGSAIPTIDLALNGKSEVEFCFKWDTDTVSGDTYDIRLRQQDGTVLNTYTNTPRVTIESMSAGAGF